MLQVTHLGRVSKSVSDLRCFGRYAKSAKLSYMTQVVDAVLEKEAFFSFKYRPAFDNSPSTVHRGPSALQQSSRR